MADWSSARVDADVDACDGSYCGEAAVDVACGSKLEASNEGYLRLNVPFKGEE